MMTTTANTTMFGKKTGTYTARLGRFEHVSAVSAAQAKAGLLAQIETWTDDRHLYGTVNGDVFLLYRLPDGCCAYDICGAGRRYASGCLMATTSFPEAMQIVTNHINQSFGGIAWQHAL